jgi:hypothetical protein
MSRRGLIRFLPPEHLAGRRVPRRAGVLVCLARRVVAAGTPSRRKLPPCPLYIASSGISRHPARARSSLLGSATVKGFEASGGVTA